MTLWGRPGSKNLSRLKETRKNDYLTLPNAITLTDDLKGALSGADICIISISAQQLRSFAKNIRSVGYDKHLPFILAMKGLEAGSGKRLTTVMAEELGAVSYTHLDVYKRQTYPAV